MNFEQISEMEQYYNKNLTKQEKKAVDTMKEYKIFKLYINKKTDSFSYHNIIEIGIKIFNSELIYSDYLEEGKIYIVRDLTIQQTMDLFEETFKINFMHNYTKKEY